MRCMQARKLSNLSLIFFVCLRLQQLKRKLLSKTRREQRLRHEKTPAQSGYHSTLNRQDRTIKREMWRPTLKFKCFKQTFSLQSLITGAWVYKHCDLRPWDPRNDLIQYECNYVICTKTRHRTPMIRTSSIVSVDPATVSDEVYAWSN